MSAPNESSQQRLGPYRSRGSTQPPQYLYLGMFYQYRMFLDLHQLISQSLIMDSRSNECLSTSMSDGDHHNYVFKRKTLDAPVARILEAQQRICREALDNNLEIEGDVSQKRQKLAQLCTRSQCGHCLAHEEKYERQSRSCSDNGEKLTGIFYSSPGLDLQHIHLRNMKAITDHASSQYPDSDISKTESRRSRSLSSEPSSLTSVSSKKHLPTPKL